MALSPEEKQRFLMLLTLLSQGQSGRQTLSTIQPILQLIEGRQAERKAQKEKRRAEFNAIGSQVGGLAGSLGGMYLIGNALAPAAAATPTVAATAPALAATAPTIAAAMPTAAASSTAAPVVATPNLLSANLVGSGGGTSTLGSIGSVALPAAVAALTINNAWEGGLKDLVRGRGDRSDWTNQAINMNPFTAPLNMGLRLLGKRSIGQMTTTGKSDAQLMRDDFRGVLKNKGIVDNDYNVTLSDGTKFNVGLDGKTKYTNVDGKTTRNAWDVDLANPLAQYAVSKIDPFIRNMYGAGDAKKNLNPEQYTGMIVNAVTSNAKSQADIDANLDAILGKKPFEGSAPVRPMAAPALTIPQVEPSTPRQTGFMALPTASAPSVRPPAPIQSSMAEPIPMTPTAPPRQQGLLSLEDQLRQGGRKLDLNGMLGLINNLRNQNGARQ